MGLKRQVQYVLAARQSDSTLKIISTQNVKPDDAQNILDAAQSISLTTITPFLGVKDSSKGLVMSGIRAGDVFSMITRSQLPSHDGKKISLYLIHRLTQGLLFLRSQTSAEIMDGYIKFAKLDRDTGRFNKSDFMKYFSSLPGVVNTVLWSNLSSFLAKMDQDYLDGQPIADMLMRSFGTFTLNYDPKMDSTMVFDLDISKIPSDIFLIGGVVDSDGSIISVLLDKQESYSSTIVQEGYMTDSKAKKSLVEFIDADPFLKAAFATSKSSLDGKGIKAEKVDASEELVRETMITIEKTKDQDVYESNASWLNWWFQRTAK